MKTDACDSLAKGVVAGEPVAVARAVSVVEDRRAKSEAHIIELLRELRRSSKRANCHRIGITGPPGAGKSSLVSVLARTIRASGKTVGVLAVDPSSPRSGGALLGDRARIEVDPNDDGLFVRSMASGGDLGGLARAAEAALEVLSAAYDVVIVESTGVGQSETDIEHVADTVVLVIQPGSGDVLQFLKAGILEIPDLFVVNKADLGAIAERAGADLRAALATLYAGSTDQTPPVIHTSTPTGAGVAELFEASEAHRAKLAEREQLEPRRSRAATAWAYRLFLRRYGEVGVENAGGAAAVRQKLAAQIDDGAPSIQAVAVVAPEYPG